MDEFELYVFQHEVWTQCEFVRVASADLAALLGQDMRSAPLARA